jgi:rubrerythrin
MDTNHPVPPYAVRKQMREATLAVGKRIRIVLVCQECGKVWRVSPNSDPQCPNCNSVDYEVR